MGRSEWRRCGSLVAFLLLLAGWGHAASAVRETHAHSVIRESITVVRAAVRVPRDTLVPPLTDAELRELRRLERADARARRRRGEAPAGDAYDPQRARRANPFARAALPTGFVGVINLFLALSVANPAVFVALSVLSFAAGAVFGAIGRKRARRRGLRNGGLGVAGFVLGLLGGALYALALALSL